MENLYFKLERHHLIFLKELQQRQGEQSYRKAYLFRENIINKRFQCYNIFYHQEGEIFY